VLVALAVTVGLSGCGTSRESSPGGTSTTSSRSAPSSTSTRRSTSTQSTSTTRGPASTTTESSVTPAVVVRHGREGRRWIALTFDAGSDAGYTAAILDLLATRHVRATFSVTGAFARANPALVARIAREGHVLVNHTDSHLSFTGRSTNTTGLSSSERAAQLIRADGAISAITGATSRPWFRPPYGDIDAETPMDVARAGYSYVLLWTVDSLGWRGTAPSTVVARCLDGATPGGILLLHVGSASTDAVALPGVIDGLRARGYELVTVATPGFIVESP
jgi:peptidoglycan/xylan/chitin deacetylase (PgdA/CDA1 family)